MAIRLSTDGRRMTNFMGRGSTHGESHERQAVGVHGNRELHGGFLGRPVRSQYQSLA